MTDSLDREIRTDVFMHVVARDKLIHLLFSEEDKQTKELRATVTGNMLLSPGDALTFSAQLADLAFEADTGLKAPHAVKEELIARHRSKLRERMRVVLNSQREKRTISNAELARKLVDICMSEVFS